MILHVYAYVTHLLTIINLIHHIGIECVGGDVIPMKDDRTHTFEISSNTDNKPLLTTCKEPSIPGAPNSLSMYNIPATPSSLYKALAKQNLLRMSATPTSLFTASETSSSLLRAPKHKNLSKVSSLVSVSNQSSQVKLPTIALSSHIIAQN